MSATARIRRAQTMGAPHETKRPSRRTRGHLYVPILVADVVRVPIECPKCSQRTPFKVGPLRDSANLKCPTCGVSFSAENDVERIDSSAALA